MRKPQSSILKFWRYHVHTLLIKTNPKWQCVIIHKRLFDAYIYTKIPGVTHRHQGQGSDHPSNDLGSIKDALTSTWLSIVQKTCRDIIWLDFCTSVQTTKSSYFPRGGILGGLSAPFLRRHQKRATVMYLISSMCHFKPTPNNFTGGVLCPSSFYPFQWM